MLIFNLFSVEFVMPKHITEPETWSVWSGDIEWEGEGGKADFRPFAVFNGKKWGVIHPRTKRPQPPTNIGACPVDQIDEIILSSDEEIIVISDQDEEDD